MPNYVYTEDIDTDIVVTAEQISRETDMITLQAWLDQFELKTSIIRGQLAVAKAAGFPDQAWATAATTAAIHADRGYRAVRRRLRELSVSATSKTDGELRHAVHQLEQKLNDVTSRYDGLKKQYEDLVSSSSKRALHRQALRERNYHFLEVVKSDVEFERYMYWVREAEKRAEMYNDAIE